MKSMRKIHTIYTQFKTIENKGIVEFASIKILRKTEVLRIVEHVQCIIVRIVLKLHTILAVIKTEC